MELIKGLNQTQHGFTQAICSGGVFPAQGSLLTHQLLAPYLPLQLFAECDGHLSTNPRKLGKKLCAPPKPAPSVHAQSISHSTAHSQFRRGCWTTRYPRSNCNDYANASSLWGQCTPLYSRPVVGVFFQFPFCDGNSAQLTTSANTTTAELERHLSFLFDVYGYFPTKCFFSILPSWQ